MPWAVWLSGTLYDLANRLLRVDSIDAGMRRTVLDAAGNRSSPRQQGRARPRAHDGLNRPSRLWARERRASPHPARAADLRRWGRLGHEPQQAAALNLLGRLSGTTTKRGC